MMDNIAVIVPVYKVEQYIHQCINSIVNQTYDDLMLIIVDDGSNDECGRYCDEYIALDPRIIVIHQNNGGLSAARNSGIELVMQDDECGWVTFIDSDDYVDYDYLNYLYNATKEYSQPIVSCNYVSTSDRNYIPNDKGSSELVSVEDYWVNNRTNATVAWGKLYRKSLFKDIRYPVGKINEDEYATYLLLFNNKYCVLVNKLLYYYCQNPNGISKKYYLYIMNDVIEAFYQQYCFFDSKSKEYPKSFLLSLEMYASSLAEGIWAYRKNKDLLYKNEIVLIRKKLRQFLKIYHEKIPFEKLKYIYIAAYPSQEMFIRVFGYVKQKIVNDKYRREN